MKKLLLFLLVAGIAGSSTACAGTTDTDEQTAATTTAAAIQTDDDNDSDDGTEPVTEAAGETDEPTDTEAPAETAEPADTETPAESAGATDPEETEDETPAADVTVEEQVIVDQDDVKITVTGISEHDIWGQQLDLVIENGTESDLRVTLEYLTVNNYMMTDLFVPSVAAGKNSNETLSLSDTGLEKAGIGDIAEITFAIRVYEEETYDDLFITEEIVLQTSLYDDYTPAPQEGGTELYSEDGVSVFYFPLDEDMFGLHLPIFIQNDSGRNIRVSADDLSVNDFMVTVLYSDSVNSGRMGIGEMMLSSSDLEELGIESADEIESLEFTFRVSDPDTYDTIFRSDPVSITID